MRVAIGVGYGRAAGGAGRQAVVDTVTVCVDDEEQAFVGLLLGLLLGLGADPHKQGSNSGCHGHKTHHTPQRNDRLVLLNWPADPQAKMRCEG
jgi:hypothetical protein